MRDSPPVLQQLDPAVHRISSLGALVAVATRDGCAKDELIEVLQPKLAEGSNPPGPGAAAAVIDLGRWTGVLNRDLELTEMGAVLRWLIATGGPERAALMPLYLWLFLEADRLLPLVVDEWADEKSPPHGLTAEAAAALLHSALDRLVGGGAPASDPESVLPTLEIYEFGRWLETDPRREMQALGARLELLVDLGLAERAAPAPGAETAFDHLVSDRTRTLARVWRQTIERPDRLPGLLEGEFFAGLAEVLALDAAPVSGLEEQLLWFARAFEPLRREIGFTPGRPVALLASLLAFEDRRLLEVADVYRAVYRAARSSWSPFLYFSGGSRFDQEFLIRLDPGLIEELEERDSGGRHDG